MKSSVAKRTGQWTAVAALGTLLTDYVNNWAEHGPEWWHVVGVIAVAVIGAVVSLAEDKTGSAAATADDPDVPDGDGG